MNHKLTNEKIEPFDLLIKRINKPKQVCKVHYDLWHLVYMDKINFVYDKKEFHQASWFFIKEGLQLIKTVGYNAIIKKLLSF